MLCTKPGASTVIVRTDNNDMIVMYDMYSTRRISHVIARTDNNDMNVMYVMYSTRSIS
jgi:uncharacterized RmlC-like cupin family protein